MKSITKEDQFYMSLQEAREKEERDAYHKGILDTLIVLGAIAFVLLTVFI